MQVLKAGVKTLIQDRGRWGHRQYGVSPAGAVDSYSQQLANLLLGNPPENATLEAALGGLRLQALTAGCVALAGLGLRASHNGQVVVGQRALHLQAGDVLELQYTSLGARAYVAFQGGLEVPEVLGSSSTHQNSRLGPAALEAGMVLQARSATAGSNFKRFVPVKPFPAVLSIRVLRGPEWEDLPELQQVFRVTAQADRMGLRLQGDPVKLARTAEMFSVAVLPGTVQLPAGGQPLVLLSDAQTTGGYPRMFQVIQADLWKLGQVLPGQQLHFRVVNFMEAEQALQAYEQKLFRLQKALELYSRNTAAQPAG
ncbi:hypothetical protein GCM10008938_07480 [Deinococcus roseus]|uniref:Carboxyltransferase domain-containing protein n=2 Tax=Deinococcus roseus TaxID=392414 RepID=A0ABQ2CVB5_9DEIO|nr:hypothetical protein GCM10008938_07480 [Deinococcus roseus]